MQALALLLDIIFGGILRRMRIVVPVLVFLFLLGLDASALGLGRNIAFLPDLAFATVLFWLIRHPSIMPIPLVFVIGIWTDALAGSPMGLSVIAYMTVFYIVGAFRNDVDSAGFFLHWGGAVTAITTYFAVQWAFYSAYELEVAAPFQNLIRAAMTAAAYPVVYLLNNLVRSFLWGGTGTLEDRSFDRA